MYNRWSIYLRHQSGKGYNQLRESGCLSLPSERTLRDYTYYNETQIGFSTDTDKELLSLVKNYEPWKMLMCLSMDEMYICEGVVYDRKTGQIMGFTDLGDITNHLARYIWEEFTEMHRYIDTVHSLRLEREATSESPFDNVAKTMLVLMVRGLCSSLQFPYAQFACRNLKAEHMYRPVVEAICRLERLGLKVQYFQACIPTYIKH